jgi:hypothetical protein
VISAFVEQDEGAVALNREAFHIAIDEPSGPRLLQRDRFEVVDRLTRFGQFVNIVAGIAAGSQGRGELKKGVRQSRVPGGYFGGCFQILQRRDFASQV